MDLPEFDSLELPRGIRLVGITFESEVGTDPIGHPDLARTVIIGRQMEITIADYLPRHEIGVSIYHETLEGWVVALDDPPANVVEMNEADFEREARLADFPTPIL